MPPPGIPGAMGKTLRQMDAVGADPGGKLGRSGDQEQEAETAARVGQILGEPRPVGMVVVAQDYHGSRRQKVERGQRIALSFRIRNHDERGQNPAVAAAPEPGGAIELERLLC